MRQLAQKTAVIVATALSVAYVAWRIHAFDGISLGASIALFLIILLGLLSLAIIGQSVARRTGAFQKIFSSVMALVFLALFWKPLFPIADHIDITLRSAGKCEEASFGEIWLCEIYVDGKEMYFSDAVEYEATGWWYHPANDEFSYSPNEVLEEDWLTLKIAARDVRLCFAQNPWAGIVEVHGSSNLERINLYHDDATTERAELSVSATDSMNFGERLHLAALAFGCFWLFAVLILYLLAFIEGSAEKRHDTDTQCKLQFARASAFVIGLVLLLAPVSAVLGKTDANLGVHSSQRILGFYEEKPGALDGVYIGASTVNMFWEAPLAWNRYGIAVWPFSSDAQNICAAEYLIREARKTQPDALYIVGIDNIYAGKGMQWIHLLTDYLPWNSNRSQIIEHWAEFDNLSVLEFYFPLLRFHSRWSSLNEQDFQFISDELKGATLNYDVEDISKAFHITEERGRVLDITSDIVDSLLDYCDAEGVNILFVTAPRAADEETLSALNTVCDKVLERGYPLLDMQKLTEDIQLNFSTDYYNPAHVNIHGAVKTTDYLSKYLIENYGFRDKRNDYEYSDWCRAYQKYAALISPHTLPFEYKDSPRDYTLNVPEVRLVPGKSNAIIWNEVEGADGYGIFKREKDAVWTLCATVDSDVLYWEDSDSETKTKTTVVAFLKRGDDIVWGNFDVAFVSSE